MYMSVGVYGVQENVVFGLRLSGLEFAWQLEKYNRTTKIPSRLLYEEN